MTGFKTKNGLKTYVTAKTIYYSSFKITLLIHLIYVFSSLSLDSEKKNEFFEFQLAALVDTVICMQNMKTDLNLVINYQSYIEYTKLSPSIPSTQ